MADLTPYATATPLMGPLDNWLGSEDATRLSAYTIYESIYRNVPDAFKLVRRGSESNPIYIPAAKTIIEASHRYLAKRWTFTMDPRLGTDADRATLSTAMEILFRREKIRAKFVQQKRWGLIRGDAVWHIVADPDKPEGRRLSVYAVDPAEYFPIYDPWNDEHLEGVHLVTPVLGEDGKTVIKRQTYRKTDAGRISYELSWWQIGAWDDRDGGELKPAESIPEGDSNKPTFFELDPRITSIPVYHVRNDPNGGPFGVSELAGMETIFAGINQAISDEDIALALEGLGLYATTSGPPVDDDDNETNWRLGPGWVVEHDADSSFTRINGIGSVQPYQDHINALKIAAREGASVPDIAAGRVDVQVAESGIALAFQMAPILAKNEEKELELLGTSDQMLYDLSAMWFPVYEGLTTAARAISSIDDPMPVNRKAVVEEVIQLLSTDPPLISAEYARTLLSEKLGYDFPDEMMNTITTEAAAFAAARNPDPFASRTASELEEQAGNGA